jgi:hypothetical protein
MKNENFDAVEIKRRGAEQIYRHTKKMSRAQDLAYWTRRSEEFRREQTRLTHRSKPSRRAG